MNKFRNFFGSVDRARFSVNHGQVVKVKKEHGWWGEPIEICTALTQGVYREGVPGNTQNNMKMIGTIEDIEFKFVGRNIQDLHRQCLSFYHENLSWVDEMVVIGNGEIFRTINKSGPSWKTAREVCGNLMNVMR